MVAGAGLPLESVILGDLSQIFIDYNNFFSDIRYGINTSLQSNRTNFTIAAFEAETNRDCITYTLMAVMVFMSAYVQMTCWVYVCERIVYKMRSEFFYSVLRQDITWYDEKKFGSITTHMNEFVLIPLNCIYLVHSTIVTLSAWRKALAISLEYAYNHFLHLFLDMWLHFLIVGN